jgi:hypothetical protein
VAGAIGVGRVPLVVFTDVCYTAYLNSFYMDAAALGGLLLMAAAAVWMTAGTPPQGRAAGVFTLAALLFVTSKAQHAVWMGLPAALLIAWGVQWNRGGGARRRGVRRVGAAGGRRHAGSTDASYRGQAMFNVCFSGWDRRARICVPLGVAPEELRYPRHARLHAGLAGGRSRSGPRSLAGGPGFARLLGWYARHPGEHARVPGGDAEGRRAGNAAGQPGEFSRGGRPGSGGADRTLRAVEQLPRLAVAPMALAHGGVVRGVPGRVPGEPLTGAVGGDGDCGAGRGRVRWRRRWATRWMRGAICSCSTPPRI